MPESLPALAVGVRIRIRQRWNLLSGPTLIAAIRVLLAFFASSRGSYKYDPCFEQEQAIDGWPSAACGLLVF
jgi:hypothetical protein